MIDRTDLGFHPQKEGLDMWEISHLQQTGATDDLNAILPYSQVEKTQHLLPRWVVWLSFCPPN